MSWVKNEWLLNRSRTSHLLRLSRIGSVNGRILLVLTVFLIAVGLSNLYSASNGGDFFYGQAKNLCIGILGFILFAFVVSPRILYSYAFVIYGAIAIMLLYVLIFGHIAGGSQRWIRLGPISGQPSELAKLAVAIVVARFFHTSRTIREYRLADLWFISLLVGFMFALIFPQPDLGTAGVCALIAAGQFAFVKIERRGLMTVAIASLTVGVLAWFFLLHDYQRLRVVNLFHSNFDPTGSGYNSLQSLVAIGSGMVSGKGFLKGTQAQLQFLPARHTDFIFAVFSEERGFLGTFLVTLAFFGLIYVTLQIARSARDMFMGMLAVGIASLFFFSVTINICMVLGMFPVVGVPLPFFSHGGTALIVMCTSLGVILGIDRENCGLKRPSRSLEKQMGFSRMHD